MAKRKTAKEKLNNGRTPVVETLTGAAREKAKCDRLLIPTPLQVDAKIREIPAGSIAVVDDLRDQLAQETKADKTCPLCTGIFWRISAEAAEESRVSGKEVAPYWRLVKANGALNEKLPGGEERQAAFLKSEGATILAGRTGKLKVDLTTSKRYRF